MYYSLNDLLREKHIKALILDLDGVITQTAKLHSQAWKKMFDAYLEDRGRKDGRKYKPLSIATDYRRFIDGIPRYDGVRNFLRSRNIVLPEGTPEDDPGTETISGLGNLKNLYFQKLINTGKVEVYPDTISWLEQQRRQGLRTAVISASKNCKAILSAMELHYLFDVEVDGIISAKLNLKGKPAPDIFLEAARQLGVSPDEAAVFEDALAGVEAARAGNFALVVGIDRTGDTEALKKQGADLVIPKFPTEPETMINQPNTQVQKHNAEELPSVLNNFDRLLDTKTPAVFLDYDGCLTPIVKEPDLAILSLQMREVLRGLADVCPVAVVSGRDRQNVQKLVQLDNLYFAGSHGFDISGPDNMHTEPGGAAAALPALDEADTILKNKLQSIQGTLVERKRYAIAVHYRNVVEEQVNVVEAVVDEVLANYPELKKGLGKKVFELKPNLDWHKGKAVLWLLEELHLNKPDILPIYIGDDITDEDAFAALQGRGIGILVGEHDEQTAAGYSLKDVAEVQIFLQKLTEKIKQERHE